MTQQQSTTWMLSGFGDEIDPDPRIQIAVLKALGARHIEVRSAWGSTSSTWTMSVWSSWPRS